MLYFGPETIMPLASAAAAIAGALLLFWQRLLAYARRFVAGVRSKADGFRAALARWCH